MNILKSIGAILAGLVTVIFLSNGTDTILEVSGVFPTIEDQLKYGFRVWWMVFLALIYRLVYLVIGGYVTAWLAPNSPMRHVIILGSIGTVLGILGAVAAWAIAPAWFLISVILLGLPCVWLGGKLKINKTKLPKQL